MPNQDDHSSIQTNLYYIRRDIDEIKLKLDNHYVTKEQFIPVQRLVYGTITIAGVALIGAIMKFLLNV